MTVLDGCVVPVAPSETFPFGPLDVTFRKTVTHLQLIARGAGWDVAVMWANRRTPDLILIPVDAKPRDPEYIVPQLMVLAGLKLATSCEQGGSGLHGSLQYTAIFLNDNRQFNITFLGADSCALDVP